MRFSFGKYHKILEIIFPESQKSNLRLEITFL